MTSTARGEKTGQVLPVLGVRRLRSKLALIGAGLCVCVTLLSLLGGRWIERRSEARLHRRADAIQTVQRAFVIASSAAEEGFGYVVGGDDTERVLALAKYAALVAAAREIAATSDLDGIEREEAVLTVTAATQNQQAALAMFAGYVANGAVRRSEYEDYEAAVDGAGEHLTRMRALALGHLDREGAECRASAALLTVGSGALAMLVSVVLAWVFAGRMTRPILSLRDAVVAFGQGARDVDPHVLGDDEVGELGAAFGQMAETIREQMAAIGVARIRLEDIFASLDDGLIVCGADGRVVMANSACCVWAGREETELIGAHVSALLRHDDARASDPSLPEREGTFVSARGHIPVRVLASQLRGDAGGHVYVARDLRPRRELEARLRQAEKLDAIGRLAGGVSHDFNNMLSVILGYTAMLLEGRDPADDLFEPLTEIQTAGERSADLTRQLLAFSRQQPKQLQVVDVNAGIEQTVKMARRMVGEHIDLQCRVANSDCLVQMEPGQIEQVMMNLIVNARDAMPGGGAILVSTARREGVRRGTAPVPGWVIITVTDTGTGMDEETRAKIFEPFFTTKEQGKGTGLGLATVFGIVSQCGGEIAVETALGRGTTFVLSFPETADALATRALVALPETYAASGTVLLVEDEEQVRDLAARILRKQGYEVLVAARPEEGLQICKDHSGPIDVLLTDVVMPRLGGRQVADAVLEMRPEVKVVFMSGYTGDVPFMQGLSDLEASFLQKPLTPETLKRRMREVMASPVQSRTSAAA